MNRIKNSDLEQACTVLNNMTGNPTEPWTRTDGRNVANVGNYHLAGAYGGWKLVQMMTTGGGIRDIFRRGYRTKRELYDLIYAYMDGIDGQKRAASEVK